MNTLSLGPCVEYHVSVNASQSWARIMNTPAFRPEYLAGESGTNDGATTLFCFRIGVRVLGGWVTLAARLVSVSRGADCGWTELTISGWLVGQSVSQSLSDRTFFCYSLGGQLGAESNHAKREERSRTG